MLGREKSPQLEQCTVITAAVSVWLEFMVDENVL